MSGSPSLDPLCPALHSSVTFRLEPAQLSLVSGLYASWVSSVESTTTSHHGVSLPAGPPRSAGVHFVVQELKMPGKGRTSLLRDRLRGWWTQLHTLLCALAHHRRRNNGEAQQRRYRESVKRH
eukprot:7626627-Pyramimonas_sp.AAC.1